MKIHIWIEYKLYLNCYTNVIPVSIFVMWKALGTDEINAKEQRSVAHLVNYNSRVVTTKIGSQCECRGSFRLAVNLTGSATVAVGCSKNRIFSNYSQQFSYLDFPEFLQKKFSNINNWSRRSIWTTWSQIVVDSKRSWIILVSSTRVVYLHTYQAVWPDSCGKNLQHLNHRGPSGKMWCHFKNGPKSY